MRQRDHPLFATGKPLCATRGDTLLLRIPGARKFGCFTCFMLLGNTRDQQSKHTRPSAADSATNIDDGLASERCESGAVWCLLEPIGCACTQVDLRFTDGPSDRVHCDCRRCHAHGVPGVVPMARGFPVLPGQGVPEIGTLVHQRALRVGGNRFYSSQVGRCQSRGIDSYG
jgi:hypothetical protein